jgi:hypothetical protein
MFSAVVDTSSSRPMGIGRFARKDHPMKLDKSKLVEAFKAAKQAAQAVVDTDDGGTCNFDAPFLRLRKSKVVEDAANEAGIGVTHGEYLGRKGYFIEVMEGQANRRTKMASEARKALQALGFEVNWYSAMD